MGMIFDDETPGIIIFLLLFLFFFIGISTGYIYLENTVIEDMGQAICEETNDADFLYHKGWTGKEIVCKTKEGSQNYDGIRVILRGE